MAFDMQENNKVGFDMTKVKVGDKLIQRDGTVVELENVSDIKRLYCYELSDGSNVTKDGYYWADREGDECDVIGFADENHQASGMSEEMQAVELLLSLGYTLKKGV